MYLINLNTAGSPLPFTVGSSPIGGTHKVEFGGVGLERGVVGVKSEIQTLISLFYFMLIIILMIILIDYYYYYLVLLIYY